MQVRAKYRLVKRLAYLGMVAGAVIAVRRARASRAATTTLGAPASWPPLEPAAEEPVAAVGDLVTPSVTATDSSAPEPPAPGPAVTTATWVPPRPDGACPLSHPVKANGNSGIYHEPGGRFYDRTQAERCYVDAASAAADGYRAAKGANGPSGSAGAASNREER